MMKKEHAKNPRLGSDVLEYIEARARKEPAFREALQDASEQIEFARYLRQIREKRGISQTQLAEMIGTKQPAIARLESGSVVPRIELLQRLAKALSMKLEIRLVPREPE